MLKLNEVIQNTLLETYVIDSCDLDDLFDAFFARIYLDQTNEEVISNLREAISDSNFKELSDRYYDLYKDLFEESYYLLDSFKEELDKRTLT